MIESTELKDIILQWYESISAGDILTLAEQLLSPEKGFLAIGSDPSEWFEGSDALLQLYKSQSGSGAFTIKVMDIKAYTEGGVGWVADRVMFKLPNGFELPFRHTFVFHKENDTWKIVHAHYSIGLNDATIGG